MSTSDPDVVVVGAGGDGPVAAWRLGEAGLDVLVLEAGPWHGNDNWPDPHGDPGEAKASSSPADLDHELLEAQFTKRGAEMGPFIGKFRWGPADSSRPRWTRVPPGDGDVFQVAGVGGTTLHYLGNHPRAFPSAIDGQGHWPADFGYADLVPYYRRNEARLPVRPAPTTPKEDLFFQGAEAEGYDLLDGKNVTGPGYRPQPNAILQPDDRLRGDYDGDFAYPDVEGATLSGHDMQGNPNPVGAPVTEKAKRSTNVTYVPWALETGNVTVRPNAFVTDVETTTTLGTPTATGVEFRDTWSGTTHRVEADAVVLAAGAIETPRLWLNSGLPRHEWVGRGMTIHWGDVLVGLWDADELEERLGQPTVDPHVGPDSGARFDYPGKGCLQVAGTLPGISSIIQYGGSGDGYAFENDTGGEPWDTRGRLVGADLKEAMADYRRSLGLLVLTDDRPHRHNRVEVTPGVTDEHGPVPQIYYTPGEADDRRRDELARIGSRILRGAGASHVHRAASPPAPLHVHSTMRMGEVTDAACEARGVDRLFVADHSVLANSLGGPNPTNTGQALAERTAEMIVERYFTDA